MQDWKRYAGPKTYYDCRAKLDGQAHYFLWYELENFEGEDGRGRVHMDRDHIHRYASLRELRAYCRRNHLELKQIGDSRYDLDRIGSWCVAPSGKGVNCRTFLEAWNLFDDLLLTLDEEKLMIKDGVKLDGAVYDKLFYGNNLPAVKPAEAPEYMPLWNDDEVAIIRDALSYGLRVFRQHLALPTRD